MAGTSFLKPTDAGKLRFGSKIVNFVADRTQPGGLATTGYDDEGVQRIAGTSSATACLWIGKRRASWRRWSEETIVRLPARRQLGERVVPAHAERVAATGARPRSRSTI